jgi:hypothetical protein
MFALLTRPRCLPGATRRPRVRLRVDRLEARDCPAFPAFNGFSSAVQLGHSVQLSGMISDPNPPSVSITFSGVMTGSTLVTSGGQFTFTANATALGTVNAVATDGQGLQATASTQVSTSAPTLTLTLGYLAKNNISLTGKVSARTVNGLTVAISGVASGRTTTDANGNYSIDLPASGVGQVQAKVTDVWGQVSQAASATVSSTKPVIDGFQATLVSGTTWTFTGTVTDATPGGLSVQFSGLNSLTGKSATTANDGSFSLTVTLAQGETGTAGAQVTNWFGLTSDLARTTVSY